jgi:rod shape-determining protein MreB and related proteins
MYTILYMFVYIKNRLNIIKKNFHKFTNNSVAIDLGTANTLIYCPNEGIVLNEPSIIAVQIIDGIPILIAVGNKAKQLSGRTANNYQVIRPLADGVISNFDLAYLMLKGFLKKSFYFSFFPKRIIIGIPAGATSVDKRAIKESVEGNVELIYEPLAAAIGAGIQISKPSGSLIIDIGGGTTEIAVISAGGIVDYSSIKIAGDKMDDSIVQEIKKNYQILISYTMAENIKKTIGCVLYDPKISSPQDIMEIQGRNLFSGMPQSIQINRGFIKDVLNKICMQIIEEIKVLLGRIEPALSADIIYNGAVLTGGPALLSGLDQLISQALGGIKVRVAKDPLYSVIYGLSQILENKHITDIVYNDIENIENN